MKSADLSALDAQNAIEYNTIAEHRWCNVLLDDGNKDEYEDDIVLWCNTHQVVLMGWNEPEREDD